MLYGFVFAVLIHVIHRNIYQTLCHLDRTVLWWRRLVHQVKTGAFIPTRHPSLASAPLTKDCMSSRVSKASTHISVTVTDTGWWMIWSCRLSWMNSLCYFMYSSVMVRSSGAVDGGSDELSESWGFFMIECWLEKSEKHVHEIWNWSCDQYHNTGVMMQYIVI